MINDNPRILNFTPAVTNSTVDGARITVGNTAYTYPIVGWAVMEVVDGEHVGTEIQPVLNYDGREGDECVPLSTVLDYLRERGRPLSWELLPPDSAS